MTGTRKASTLAVASLTVQYGRRTALEDASLVIEPGSVTSVVGPNGAGKSTLLNCVAGLVKPHRGTVHLATST